MKTKSLSKAKKQDTNSSHEERLHIKSDKDYLEPMTKVNRINFSIDNGNVQYLLGCTNDNAYIGMKRIHNKYSDFSSFGADKIREMEQNISLEEHSLYSDKAEVGVCFSGGYDSVLLMIEAIKQGKTVLPIRMGINNGIPGVGLFAEYTLLQLRKMFPNKICKSIMPIKNIDFETDVTGYFIQPSLAYSLAYLPEEWQNSLKEIQVGFICKDECVSFTDEFENLYKAALKFVYPYTKEPIHISYPLKKYTKQYVYDKLTAYRHMGNLLMITCENPVFGSGGTKDGTYVYFTPCRYCMSCYMFDRVSTDRANAGILLTFGEVSNYRSKLINAIRNIDDGNEDKSNEYEEIALDD